MNYKRNIFTMILKIQKVYKQKKNFLKEYYKKIKKTAKNILKNIERKTYFHLTWK